MKKVAPPLRSYLQKSLLRPRYIHGLCTGCHRVRIEIDHVETEKEFDPPVGRVQSRFDLFAQDVRNRVIVHISQIRYKQFF